MDKRGRRLQRACLGWGGLLAAALLGLPLLALLAQGVGGAALAIWQGAPLAGGGSFWPDARVQALLVSSLALSLAAAAGATAIAALCGWALLAQRSLHWRLALAASLAASFCFGTVVHLLAWRSLFPVVTGGPAGWALATTALALRYAPLATALCVAGLMALDRSELETAVVTGGGRALWAVGRGRLLRVGGMCMAAVAALVFCEPELPALVGVRVYAEEFLSQVALEADTRAAMALGWPMMAMALLCALALSGLPRMRPAASGAARAGWIGAWTHAPARVDRVAVTAALSIAALPLLLLALGSLRATGRWPAHAGAALFSSLWVAALSAALACAWAWALAAAVARSGEPVVKAANALLWLAMLWPPAMTGLAIAAWPLPPDAGAAVPLLAAHGLRQLPFAAWLLLALRDAAPRAPSEQLRLLGPRRWAAWRHVHLPAAGPGLLAAFMLCVGLSLAELTATVLTVPAGMETVILRLYNLLHYGDQRGVMVLALVQGSTVALLVAATLALLAISARRAAASKASRAAA
jgi:iron(III) transport system permease protein